MGFFNVAPKKEMFFFFYHFPKEYIGRFMQNAVHVNTKLYINSKILSCYSKGYIGDLPGVFSDSSLDTFMRSVNL